MRTRFVTRIALFALTNLAMLAVLAVVLRLLGVDRILDEQGVGLDYRALLVFSAVIGFGGAIISLAMSKWVAIVLWFSRRRELRADRGAARLRGPRPMIAALERLGAIRGPAALPDSLRAFGIRGANRRGLARLFMSHPPLEERIAALRKLPG
jgi:heat shock protein HtpX